MRLVLLVLLTIAVLVLPQSAGATRHHGTSCDNNGRCTLASGFSYGEERQQYRKKYKKSRHVWKKARKHRVDANGNRARGKTPPWNMVQVVTVQGFKLTVHPAYAHKFLRFFEILEQNHVRIPKELVGCYASRGHVSGSNHYKGLACDIQTGWNKTIPELAYGRGDKWIRQAGLYSGCGWDRPDCGHVEAVRGTHNRPPPLVASLEKFKSMQSTANYQP